ncbi:ABC transporter permease [candidate division KSB1 bacterium]
MNNNKIKPPKIALWILNRVSLPEDKSALNGDLEEDFKYTAEKSGIFHASFICWMQVLRSLFSFFKYYSTGSFAMFKNFLKIAIRNLNRQKGYSFINIAGFAVGLTCCFLILLFIRDELSYDRFHENADRIYRIAGTAKIGNLEETDFALTPAPMAETMIRDYPQISNAVRIYKSIDVETPVQYENNSFNEKRFLYADASVFEFFNFSLIEGDPETVLKEPYSVILTESASRKYFGSEDPIGKTLRVDNSDYYLITGIAKDVPENSHIHFDFLASLNTLNRSGDPSWLNSQLYTYILFEKGASAADLEADFPNLVKKYVGPYLKAASGMDIDEFFATGGKWENYLQPLSDIHLHSDMMFEIEANGDIKNVYIFSVIALVILLTACINFVNLSTARSSARSKEIGIKKTLGSSRKNLIFQFLAETIFLTLISFVIAVCLVKLLLPYFNEIAAKQLELNIAGMLKLLPFLTCAIVIIGALTGIYPAFFLSSFKPVSLIQRNFNKPFTGCSFMRSSLVVFQFITVSVLFIGTFVVYNQVEYIKSRKLGYNKDQLLVINIPESQIQNANILKENLVQHDKILSATVSDNVPGKDYGIEGFKVKEKGDNVVHGLTRLSTDTDFLKTYELELLEGRFLSKEFPSDNNAIIINESAAKSLGLEYPVGKILLNMGDESPVTIIGLVKDFNFQSLHKTVGPLFIGLEYRPPRYISIKLRSENVEETLAYIKGKWGESMENMPFDYFFLDSYFDSLYRAEQSTMRIFTLFSILAVFIGCIGLSGLAAYTIEKRKKEMSIRKIVGASIQDNIVLLIKEYAKYLLIANVFAWPLAFYLMQKWLQNFAYKVSLGIFTFIISAVLTCLIAFVSICYQTVKAAMENPVDNLRTE